MRLLRARGTEGPSWAVCLIGFTLFLVKKKETRTRTHDYNLFLRTHARNARAHEFLVLRLCAHAHVARCDLPQSENTDKALAFSSFG